MTAEHFVIRVSGDPEPVARVGRRDGKEFVVEFLDEGRAGSHRDKVRGDLRFHLVEKGERDPWDSARRRFSGISRQDLEVRWSWVPGGTPRVRPPPRRR